MKENNIKEVSPEITTFDDLINILQSSFTRELYSALGEHKYLLVDLNKVTASFISQTLITNRLKQLPCPCIGIAELPEALSPDIINAFDVIINQADKATNIISNIEKNPATAMTLVQLLRLSENLDVYDGLLAESLAYASLQGGAEAKAFLESRPATQQSTNDSDKPAVTLTRNNDQLTLTLNRPEYRNAYSIAMRDGLIESLKLLADDCTINKAIIKGSGACFCIGGDLEEFGTAPDTATAHAVRCARNVGLLLHEQKDRVECHVHRACIGSGIELPAFTHKIIATENTFFQLPEITMGLIPGAGGTVSIARRIGRQRLTYWALSAKKINVETALSWGLIDEITNKIEQVQ